MRFVCTHMHMLCCSVAVLCVRVCVVQRRGVCGVTIVRLLQCGVGVRWLGRGDMCVAVSVLSMCVHVRCCVCTIDLHPHVCGCGRACR